MANQLSPELLGFLRTAEGSNKSGDLHVAYQDSAGIWTIGYGHVSDDVTPGTTWTEEQANAALESDVQEAYAARQRLVNVDLNPNEEAAVVSLIYNVGAGAFGKSKALANLNAGDREGFLREAFDPEIGFTKHVNPETGVKEKLDGLVNRRSAEQDLWLTPVASQPAMFANDPEPSAPPEPAADPLSRPEAPLPERLAKPTLEQLHAGVGDIAPPSMPTFDSPAPSPVELPAPILRSPTNAQLLQADADAEQRAADTSFASLMKSSFRNDNSAGQLMDALDTPDFFYDRKFDIDAALRDSKERLDALGGTADAEEVGERLGTALNRDHFEYLLSKTERQRDDQRMFAEAGWKGFAATILPNLVDPVDIVVGLAAAPVGAGKKLTRLGSAVKAATAAGVSNASIEAYLAANNPYRDGSDVGFAFAAGLTLGGPLGALTAQSNKRLHALADDLLAEEMERTAVRQIAKHVNEQGGPDSAGAARRILEDLDRHDADYQGNLDVAPTSRARGEQIADEAGDQGEFGYGFLQKLQRNYLGRLFYGTTDTTRKVASRILEGGILVDKKATRAFTAEGRMNNLYQTSTARFFYDTAEDFKAWSAKNGYNAVSREVGIEANEKFFTEVGHALRGGTAGVSAEAASAASKIRPMLDEFHAMAKEVGIPGFIDSDPVANFFPRHWEQSKMAKVFEQVDDKSLAEWFTESLLSTLDEEADRALAKRIARGFVKGLRRQHHGLDDMLMHGIPLDDVDRLADLFDGVDEGLAEELIKRIERQRAEAGSGDAGNPRHGRNRLRFDENYVEHVRTKEGGSLRLGLDDMTLTDAGKVLPRYFRTMSGWIGLAKEAGIRSQADVNAVKTKISLDGGTRDELTAFDDAVKLVTGRSVEDHPYGGVAQASRIAAGYDYTRLGGSFGVAQLPEMGNIVGEVGVVNFIRGIPEFADLLKRAETGELTHDLARELEELIAPGTDYALTGARSNFDEHGLGFDSEALRKLDGLLARGGRITSIVSLMAPINAALERIATHETAVNWGRFAMGTKNVAEWKGARFRAAGISDEMRERIFAQMRTHSKFEGDKLRKLNTEAWDDLEALDTYRMGLDRTRRYVIQRNDLGNTGKYIHNPVGKMMTRFMNFMLNSINKQLIKGVHHRDIQTFVSFSTSMFLGATAYTLQTAADYANDPKKRKERLDVKRIAAAGYQRAGFSAITIPMIDSTLGLMGYDQLFQYGRTSGLGTDFISGNPTITGAQDVVNTATLPLRLALQDDYRFSQDDWQRIQRLIPFQRVLGVKNAFHAIEDANNLPRRSQPQ